MTLPQSSGLKWYTVAERPFKDNQMGLFCILDYNVHLFVIGHFGYIDDLNSDEQSLIQVVIHDCDNYLTTYGLDIVEYWLPLDELKKTLPK